MRVDLIPIEKWNNGHYRSRDGRFDFTKEDLVWHIRDRKSGIPGPQSFLTLAQARAEATNRVYTEEILWPESGHDGWLD